MNSAPKRRFVVSRGVDAGTQFVLDGQVKIVDRARDASIVLADRSVSRHHFYVHATDAGVHIRVCRGAAPLIVDGREVATGEVRVGSSIVVGDTVLAVAEMDGDTRSASDGDAHGATTTIGALLI